METVLTCTDKELNGLHLINIWLLKVSFPQICGPQIPAALSRGAPLGLFFLEDFPSFLPIFLPDGHFRPCCTTQAGLGGRVSKLVLVTRQINAFWAFPGLCTTPSPLLNCLRLVRLNYNWGAPVGTRLQFLLETRGLQVEHRAGELRGEGQLKLPAQLLEARLEVKFAVSLRPLVGT